VHQGIGLEGSGDRGREAVPIDRQRAAGRHLMSVALGHDEGPEAAHLLVEQADRIGLGLVRPERVRADELGQPVGLVGVGAANGSHLVQDDGQSGSRDLPGGLGPGKASADNVNGLDLSHRYGLTAGRVRDQPASYADITSAGPQTHECPP
jgi:hypothetical protein